MSEGPAEGYCLKCSAWHYSGQDHHPEWRVRSHERHDPDGFWVTRAPSDRHAAAQWCERSDEPWEDGYSETVTVTAADGKQSTFTVRAQYELNVGTERHKKEAEE